MSEPSPEKTPERPLECSQCRKETTILYKEVLPSGINCFVMCADCPVLAGKFSVQIPAEGEISSIAIPAKAPIVCERCRTPLEAVRMGEPLGCAECYEVFGDVVLAELRARRKIPTSAAIDTGSLHLGSSPGKPPFPTALSSQLTALNEALNEALKKENYEQAAWIRDRIKTLLKSGSSQMGGTPNG